MVNKNKLFAAGAGCGGLLSGFMAMHSGIADSPVSSWVVTGGMDAALIGSSLVYVQNFYQTQNWRNTTKVFSGMVKGLIIGMAGGFLAMIAMNIFGGGGFGRFIGWAISGAIAGYVASTRVPNLKKKTAILAGAVGGGLGEIVMSIGLGYTIGVCVTGAAIGLMVAVSEVMFRKMSLNVTIKPKSTGISLEKTRSFNLSLGENPITIGYNSEMDIQLKLPENVTRKHAANIQVKDNKAYFHDLVSGTSTELTASRSFNFNEAELQLVYSQEPVTNT